MCARAIASLVLPSLQARCLAVVCCNHTTLCVRTKHTSCSGQKIDSIRKVLWFIIMFIFCTNRAHSGCVCDGKHYTLTCVCAYCIWLTGSVGCSRIKRNMVLFVPSIIVTVIDMCDIVVVRLAQAATTPIAVLSSQWVRFIIVNRIVKHIELGCQRKIYLPKCQHRLAYP